eukprot:CAMPEP_0172538634 /NCGR_PEP_ID=MMETSP1067-20121228/9990_1 /TAXON_ID=265564 ORGANISM="Thalassiosira punctigera, Strain Tpunct2005C2" /NCGR_SAMPLE_ID=MMETSP1067 /ASSEMBLY_ACC=CAM_ASM_000444 /LENGTH=652 /DNA_ID=CAMNT_0013324175 /DNA_START=129 /DNA_END=2087 /DNA_ORIENTATION=-
MLARSALLRRTAALAARRQQQQQRRPLVTKNPHKRALNLKQLEGEKGAAATPPPPPPPTKRTAAPPSSGGGGGGSSTKPADVEKTASARGGGGSGLLLPLLLLGGVGAGGAYYTGMIPDDYLPDFLKGGASEAPKKKEADVKVAKELREAVEEVMGEKEAEVVVATIMEETEEDAAPPVEKEMVVEEEVVVSLDHPEDGNRVDLDKINAFYQTVDVSRAKQEEEEAREAAARAAEFNESEETQTVDPMSALTTAANAMSELQSTTSLENSQTLAAAKAALRSDLDESYFADLESLSPGELRVRIVQLATEMSDRTKWEAVRLKEFLAMKEKEVGDKYLEILQKQRLEFESLLAQRLREQEDQITRQANAALAAKEESVQGLLKATSDAREQEMKEVLEAEARRIADELELQHQTQLQNELARMKQSHAKELEAHVATMEGLKDKLSLLEGRLEVSRNYESGSRRAHLVSAAALALASKLEGSEGAAVELAALRGAVAGEGGVIASASAMIPRSRAARGVPTVVELQASFDETYRVGRQAAMVPEGRAGLGGQLLGMVFAKLSMPPSPDAAPTSEEEGSVADGILSLARKYVQLGDLEKAVEQLDRLKEGGQVAYVMRDWKSKAADRVSTERALKAIKLECALLNKDLVGSES